MRKEPRSGFGGVDIDAITGDAPWKATDWFYAPRGEMFRGFFKVATLWGYCSVPVSILVQEGYTKKEAQKAENGVQAAEKLILPCGNTNECPQR